LPAADAVAVLAREAIDALDRGSTRPPPSQLAPFHLADGYRVAARVDAALATRGWRHVGRKLAFTDRTMWSRIGAESPAWGYVYDQTTHLIAAAGGSIRLGRRVAPRLETEIVVGLRHAPAGAVTSSDIASCLAWAALGFEVIDCHYPGWKFMAADALADIVFHALLIVGPRRAFPSPEDAMTWARNLPGATVTTQPEGGAAVRGSPRAVLGDPLDAIAALVGLVAEADPLRAGELVTTGTMTTPFDVTPSHSVRAEISDLGLEPLSVRFS
jgi:2-keto-4-pentenoate hydratase